MRLFYATAQGTIRVHVLRSLGLHSDYCPDDVGG